METIDFTPSWAEWARVYASLAESGERKACAALRADLLRMGRLADAYTKALKPATRVQNPFQRED